MTKRKNELISIIVPVYKVEKYLSKCIDSILSQTYKNFELILVDDGSPDNCPQICDEYAKKDDRIRVIHKKNSGVSETRNEGVRNAKGTFICFVDSDDYVSENYISSLLDAQKINNSDIVFGRYCRVFNDKVVNVEEDLKSLVEDKKYEMFFSDYSRVMGSMCRLLIRKTIFENIQFDKSLKYCEDLYFVLQLFNLNCTISYTNEIIYYYVCNVDSVTQKFSKQSAYNYESAILKCIDLLKNNIDKTLISNMLFGIFTLAIKQAVVTNDYTVLVDFEKYNTKDNYKAYKKYNKTIKQRIKAYLCRHKMFWILKILFK